jgi:FAD synthase
VSSSRIRTAIATGDVALAAELLGRPHRVACRVIGPGRLALDRAVLAPPPGSYRGRIRAPGSRTGALPVEVRVHGAAEASLVVPAALAGDELLLEFLAPHR